MNRRFPNHLHKNIQNNLSIIKRHVQQIDRSDEFVYVVTVHEKSQKTHTYITMKYEKTLEWEHFNSGTPWSASANQSLLDWTTIHASMSPFLVVVVVSLVVHDYLRPSLCFECDLSSFLFPVYFLFRFFFGIRRASRSVAVLLRKHIEAAIRTSFRFRFVP